MNEQEYHIPAGFGEAVLVEKKSRFIGRVWPVADEDAAMERIAAMREQHRDATHNVYAYSIRGGVVRCSDDGEPQGTSGMPTLNVFQSEDIHNVCCVVTRYYGGIQLGAGGLVRAYSRTAKMALDAAGTCRMRQWRMLRFPCPYALYERVQALAKETGAVIDEAAFAETVRLAVLVPSTLADAFAGRVCEMSSGAVCPGGEESVFRGVRVR